ncbi:uncharacterized protein [Asterias amurensis]|uniref:uncharacterized protein n=1 Tax=Asterias amurensis TaxID=7602 RepID=UPI003AB5E9D1
MAAKLVLALMALAVMTAFVVADEEEELFPVEDLMEFVKRGKGRNRGGRGRMGPLTKDDLTDCEKFGQSCVCDKRKFGMDRFLVCHDS